MLDVKKDTSKNDKKDKVGRVNVSTAYLPYRS